MQENKIHILSTADLDPGVIQEALERGVVIDCVSFISTSGIEEEELKKKIRDLEGQKHAVAFTSAHAVQAVGRWTQSPLRNWTIYCLEGATKKAIEKTFGPVAIMGTARDGRLLAKKILSDGVKKLIFFSGNLRRDELPDELSKQAVQIQEWVVYETNPTPKTVGSAYDGILFFSPSGAKSYFSCNSPSAGVVLFAIGPTTAQAVREFSSNHLVKSTRPGKALLVNISIRYFIRRQSLG
jgi:uroporphyrinogen-III synthase